MKRINLKSGKLYWCSRHQSYRMTDKLEVWKYAMDNDLEKNSIIDIVYTNDQNIFCFIETIQHDLDDSLWWHKIITSRGNVGYFLLGDEEFYYLGLNFVLANHWSSGLYLLLNQSLAALAISWSETLNSSIADPSISFIGVNDGAPCIWKPK